MVRGRPTPHHVRSSVCPFRNNGADLGEQQQISIPETFRMASVPPVIARTVEMRRATVRPEPVATAIVRMVPVRMVCVPADNVRRVPTDNVLDVPTGSAAEVRVQVETA